MDLGLGLAGKVAIVTGATANIGRAVALELAREQAALIAVGRDAEAGARLVEEARSIRRNGPLGRATAKPEEVAAAVLYLASRQAAFVTGQTLHVDGGVLL